MTYRRWVDAILGKLYMMKKNRPLKLGQENQNKDDLD
jgi:hypothetical protein